MKLSTIILILMVSTILTGCGMDWDTYNRTVCYTEVNGKMVPVRCKD